MNGIGSTRSAVMPTAAAARHHFPASHVDEHEEDRHGLEGCGECHPERTKPPIKSLNQSNHHQRMHVAARNGPDEHRATEHSQQPRRQVRLPGQRNHAKDSRDGQDRCPYEVADQLHRVERSVTTDVDASEKNHQCHKKPQRGQFTGRGPCTRLATPYGAHRHREPRNRIVPTNHRNIVPRDASLQSASNHPGGACHDGCRWNQGLVAVGPEGQEGRKISGVRNGRRRLSTAPRPVNNSDLDYSHGPGVQGVPSGAFLKCVLVTHRAFRYVGSSTSVVTTRKASPLASLARL